MGCVESAESAADVVKSIVRRGNRSIMQTKHVQAKHPEVNNIGKFLQRLLYDDIRAGFRTRYRRRSAFVESLGEYELDEDKVCCVVCFSKV